MMWQIPAKTFLVGEYAALKGAPALILTTTPCFELALTTQKGLHGIHPNAPAGKWWTEQNLPRGLLFHDPYNGQGGMGASSAQFIGAYIAALELQDKKLAQDELLQAYQHSTQAQSLRPSGYDIIAQLRKGCVFIHHQQQLYNTYNWPFAELGFILLHTGKKLTTHLHLQKCKLPMDVDKLSQIVVEAHQAFKTSDSQHLIHAVNTYYQELLNLNLVAPHTQSAIEVFKQHPEVKAAKGCGAMGADVLLLLLNQEKVETLVAECEAKGLNILATHHDLHIKNALI